MGRALTAVLLGLLGVLVSNGVALAHAGGLSSSTNEPVVLRVEPPVPGIDLTVVEAGARLRLDNHTDRRVAVTPPAGSVINALPVVDPGDSAFWSDPRIVAASGKPRPPDARLDWRIPLRVGDRDVVVIGEQSWPAPPDAALWWLLLVVVGAVPVVLVALGTRVARWGLAVCTAGVMVSHIVHMYGSALVVAQGRLLWVFLAASGFAIVGWPIGVVGAWLTARNRPAGPLLCCVAGALLAIIIAPADLFSFHDAVIPFAWGADLDRLLIALTVGGGLGVLFAAWLLMRRTPAPVGDAP